MKKNDRDRRVPLLTKTIRIMKVTSLCNLLAVCSISASTYAQSLKFSIHKQNSSISEVFKEIEKKSDFTFFFNDNQINVKQKVSVSANNASIEDVLAQVLQNTGYNYQIIDKQILIKVSDKEVMAVPTIAQSDKKITGTVLDATGMPVIGANVMVKGTTNGTITDMDGRFSLDVEEGATLVVSYIGFANQEIKVGKQTNLSIAMKEDAEALDELVVVGYGTQKKVNVIGSVSQVSSEQLSNRPVSSLSNALTGEMTGVTVIQRSGKPGASNGEIRVRGVGSFGATPDALILIDGIPGDLSSINPEEVESISVLKDAASAAIYGARAANGVVLVSTKRGKSSKIQVSYNGYAGWQTPTDLPEYANSWEYAEMYNEAIGREAYSAEDIQKYKNGEDRDNYPNTHFLEDVLSKNGFQTSHDLNLNGGNETNQYFISLGYLNQDGIVEKNYYRRYNARVNIVNELMKNLTLTTRLSGSVEEREEPQTVANVDKVGLDGIVYNASRYPSIYVGQYSNGEFGSGPFNIGTPTSWLASDSYLRNPVTRVNANVKLDWKPIEGLTLTGIGGYNFALAESESYRASQVLNSTLTLPFSFKDQSRNKSIYKTLQFLAEYNKEYKGHNFNLLLGYSFESQDNDDFTGYRQNFPSNDYTAMDMGDAENQRSGGYDYGWTLLSYFGRFKYDYKQKYLFETTVRRDGSSRFPPSKKYGVFPSFALGWRVSEEHFFEPLKNILSNMKLKASWGILGNQNISNYPYQSTLAPGLNYPFGGVSSVGAGLTTLKDNNLHWESTQTTDVGIETGWFHGLLDFNMTYFIRNTYDILYKPSSSISDVLGLDLSELNTGKMKNSGFEFEITHQKQVGDFHYKVSGNLSIINNEVVDLGVGNVNQPNGLIGNGSDLFIGYPMQMYYGYLSDGVFVDENDIANWADQTKVTVKPQPGDVRYKDISGPNGVPDGIVDPTYDRTYLGSRIPKYTYSANLNLDYKGIDFRILFQGVTGVKGYLGEHAGFAFYNQGSIQKWQMEERFDPKNPQRYVQYPRLEIISNASSGNYASSDFWVISAAYCRIKNLQLGYTIPKSITNKIKIDRLRLYFSADNLYTFKKYRDGWDPEINTSGAYYPILSTYTFGINVNF